MSSASRPLPRPLYRARQFFASLRPRIGEAERDEVAAYLTPAQLRLFQAMVGRDQRHCLDVFQALRRHGCDDPDLLAAALLHDVGKGDVRLWHRVAYVLLAAVSPRLLLLLAATDRPSWRGALARLHGHPERGAALVAAVGASDAVVRLIRGDPAEGRLALLQAADDSC